MQNRIYVFLDESSLCIYIYIYRYTNVSTPYGKTTLYTKAQKTIMHLYRYKKGKPTGYDTSHSSLVPWSTNLHRLEIFRFGKSFSLVDKRCFSISVLAFSLTLIFPLFSCCYFGL